MIEFSVIPYKFKYLDKVRDLLGDIPHHTLPKVGFCVLSGDTPVACAFLRRLEPCYAQIDIASTRYMGTKTRENSLKLAIEAILNEVAKECVISVVVADIETLNEVRRLGCFNESICRLRP